MTRITEPSASKLGSDSLEGIHLDKHVQTHDLLPAVNIDMPEQSQLMLKGGRCAIGPCNSVIASIHIVDGQIARIESHPTVSYRASRENTTIDLSGYLILPGLVNAHDHLEFSLFPRLANPPYKSYVDWGTDIHRRFPDAIAKHRLVPKPLRLWWGGVRNLLCGATTVCHHNPLWPELQRRDFPVRVVQEYGWGHSLALGGDLRAARQATRIGNPFILHACEGVDADSHEELWELDRLGLLDSSTILVHGLAIDAGGIALMRERQASLIACPSSNSFLFETLPDISELGAIDNVSLGNDSPLTAEGDLLDEIQFAARFCGISPETLYRMVTESPATILRLKHAEGSLTASGIADMIAIADAGLEASEMLATLRFQDIELVIIGGRVQLASGAMLERIPLSLRNGLEPLYVDATLRWVRAPVSELLRQSEEVLGSGEVRLGKRTLRTPLQLARQT